MTTRMTKKMIKDAYEYDGSLTYTGQYSKEWKNDLFSKTVLKVRSIKFDDKNLCLPKYKILEKCYKEILIF